MPKSVTSFLGVETFHGFRQIDNADSLFASAFRTDVPVRVVVGGKVIATLTVDHDVNAFAMDRRLQDGSYSNHHIAIVATDPERLLAHWKGFVMRALTDFELAA